MSIIALLEICYVIIVAIEILAFRRADRHATLRYLDVTVIAAGYATLPAAEGCCCCRH